MKEGRILAGPPRPDLGAFVSGSAVIPWHGDTWGPSSKSRPGPRPRRSVRDQPVGEALISCRGKTDGGCGCSGGSTGCGTEDCGGSCGGGGSDSRETLRRRRRRIQRRPGSTRWFQEDDVAFRLSPDPEDDPDLGEDGLPDVDVQNDLDNFYEGLEDALADGIISPAEAELLDELADQLDPEPDPEVPDPVDDPCAHPWSGSCAEVDRALQDSVSPFELAAAADDVAFVCNDALWDDNPDAQVVLTEAVAMLQSSTDLVARACCVYFGPNAPECECLLDYIAGNNGKIRFCAKAGKEGETDDNPCNEMASGEWPNLDKIYVYQAFFEGGTGGCPTTQWFSLPGWEAAADRHCEIVTLASVLTHEIMHKCVRGEGDHDDSSWDYSWLGDYGSDYQQANCDILSTFTFSAFGHVDSLESLLQGRYC